MAGAQGDRTILCPWRDACRVGCTLRHRVCHPRAPRGTHHRQSVSRFAGASCGRRGRAANALVVSLALLGAGVWLERRETERSFARGVIGAGWAALYATAYAIHALPAARIT